MREPAGDLPGTAGSFGARRLGMDEATPLVTLDDVTEIELLILRRLRDVTIGNHQSLAHGSGSDYAGVRDWQAGDRFSTIDWAQSTLTNFSPLVVREFDQPSTATAFVIVDGSASTRCGIDGVPIAASVARTIATIGMSSVFFQDMFGIAVLDESQRLATIRPQVGKSQVIRCLEAYESGRGLVPAGDAGSLGTIIGSFLRKTSLVAYVSDFLVQQPRAIVDELSLINRTHDVFVVVIDASFAFAAPSLSAGWIETFDVETGHSRLMSSRELASMTGRVRKWQDEVSLMAQDMDLDVVWIDADSERSDLALAAFVAERRLRKKS